MATRARIKTNNVVIQRQYLDNIGIKLGVTKMEDWYHVTSSKVAQQSGGLKVLSKYNNSLIQSLRSVYPEYTWKEYLFDAVPRNYWDSMDNQREFIDEVGKKLGVEKMDDWYKITESEVRSNGGNYLLMSKYKSSLYDTLSTIYPEYDWLPWRFKCGKVPRHYWENSANHRKFFDWFATQNGIKINNTYNWDQWYLVSLPEIAKTGALSLVKGYYHSSLARALQSVYKEHDWQMWKFQKAPAGFWDDLQSVTKYIHYLSEQLGINKLEDWLHITNAQIAQQGGAMLLRKEHGILNILVKVYPDYPWIMKSREFKERKYGKGQSFLKQCLEQLFPDNEIFMNYRHHIIKHNETLTEFDFYIPQLAMAIEYFGQHHYMDHFVIGDVQKQKEMDTSKNLLCQQAGITLIEVPYWWDRSKGSLVATIAQSRSDLFDPALLAVGKYRLLKDSTVYQSSPIPASDTSKITRKEDTGVKYAYQIVRGKRTGSAAQCQVCKRKMEDRNEHRIQIRGAFIPAPNAKPQPAKYYVCINSECVDRVLKNSGQLLPSGVFYPMFDGKIGGPEQLLPTQLDVFEKRQIAVVP